MKTVHATDSDIIRLVNVPDEGEYKEWAFFETATVTDDGKVVELYAIAPNKRTYYVMINMERPIRSYAEIFFSKWLNSLAKEVQRG